MQRREVLAGVGSVGILGSAGMAAIWGLPSSTGDPNASGNPVETNSAAPDQITIETVDAPGSEAGDVQVPAVDQPTFIDFFGTWCPPCIEQMPALAAAHERIGSDVLFLSVTNEAVGSAVTEDELVEWWDKHGGNWLLGLDPTAELTARYLAGGYPSAVAIGPDGQVQWSDSGVKSTDELIMGIEQTLETGANA